MVCDISIIYLDICSFYFSSCNSNLYCIIDNSFNWNQNLDHLQIRLWQSGGILVYFAEIQTMGNCCGTLDQKDSGGEANERLYHGQEPGSRAPMADSAGRERALQAAEERRQVFLIGYIY